MVELLVIVAILGLLVLLAIPSYTQYVETVRVDRTKADIRTLEKDINAYAIENGRFPDHLSDIHRETLVDAWGHPFGYQNLTLPGATPMEKSNTAKLNTVEYFDLYSMGRDGDGGTVGYDATNCKDDVVLTANGGDVGMFRDATAVPP